MLGGRERAAGRAIRLAAAAAFAYYTAWVLLRPLLEGAGAGGASRDLVLRLFPNTFPALAGPTVVGALLFAGVTARVGWELAGGRLHA